MLIVIVCIVITLVAVVFTMHNLGKMDLIKKIIFIVFGILICFAITSIMVLISNSNVEFPNEKVQKNVENVIVMMFTSVNTLITMPVIANQVNNFLTREKNKEKQKVIKNTIIFLIIVFVIFIFEIHYMRNVQDGILKIINELVEKKLNT